MFSLQRLLSKGNRFFDLLEAGAEEARQSVQALVELIKAPQDGRTWTSSSSAAGRRSRSTRR